MTQGTSADNTTVNPALHRRFSLRWLLPAAAIFLLWRLSYAPFWNPDEGRYASAAMEMVSPLDGSTPDWVVPHLNTLPRLNKPPLVYWLGAISFKVFGVSEAAGRLVPALAAVGVMLLLWSLGRSMFDERAGVLAALIWATSAFPFAMARTMNTDMLLCFATALTLYGIWGALNGATPAFVVAGIGMGLALLAKGPVGMALPLLIGYLFLYSARRWPDVRGPGVLLALVVALIVAVPWYWAIEQRQPGFLRHFLIGENLGRFSGKEEYHDPKGFWFYLPVVLLGLLPWTSFLPQVAARWQLKESVPNTQRLRQWLLLAMAALATIFVLVRALLPGAEVTNRDLSLVNAFAPLAIVASLLMRCRLRDEVAAEHRTALLFLWLWALVPVVLFSLSSTKLVTYVLLSFPAFALLLAEAVSSLDAPQWQQRLRANWSMGAMLLLNAVLAVAAVVFLTGNKTLPRAEGLPWAIVGCTILIVSSIANWWAWKKATTGTLVRRVAGAQLAGAFVLFLFLVTVAGRIAPYEDASGMIRALQPQLQPDDQFIEFKTFQPTAIFYTARPVPVIDFINNSGLDPEEFKRSPLFSRHVTARELLNQPQRVYLLIRWNAGIRQLLGKVYLVARNNDFAIVSNRPKPAGFQYDFTAPRKRNR